MSDNFQVEPAVTRDEPIPGRIDANAEGIGRIDADESERRRTLPERQRATGRLSVVVQSRRLAEGKADVPASRHLHDIVLLPGFTVDDARKLKGGEGQQFRVDAKAMVELETARVAQLHEIVGTDDVWLACDGVILDPVDWTSLDNALATAQEQIVTNDEGDSDVKEIAIISLALQETARYQAIEGPEQLPPDPPEGGEGEGGVLGTEQPVQGADESYDDFLRRYNAWQQSRQRSL